MGVFCCSGSCVARLPRSEPLQEVSQLPDRDACRSAVLPFRRVLGAELREYWTLCLNCGILRVATLEASGRARPSETMKGES